jgi:hypothetical protein
MATIRTTKLTVLSAAAGATLVGVLAFIGPTSEAQAEPFARHHYRCHYHSAVGHDRWQALAKLRREIRRHDGKVRICSSGGGPNGRAWMAWATVARPRIVLTPGLYPGL